MRVIKTEILKDGRIKETFENGTTSIHFPCPVIEPSEPSEPTEPEPTEEEIYQAEVLLNQTEIINKQAEQDEVLAEILLNGLEV